MLTHIRDTHEFIKWMYDMYLYSASAIVDDVKISSFELGYNKGTTISGWPNCLYERIL